MKIAIAATGKAFNSLVDARFGRCPYHLIVDSETGKFKAIENKAGREFRGAGVSVAQVIANKKVGAVIAGNFGPNAVEVLRSAGIEIFRVAPEMTVKKAFEDYSKGKLEKISEEMSGTLF